MLRFLIHPDQINEGTVRLAGSQYRHAVRVLRLGPGDEVMLLSGDREWIAVLEQVGRSELTARVVSVRPAVTEPSAVVTLVQALVKADRMDWVVQKCTELGVKRLIPVSSERAVVKPDAVGGGSRGDRWRRIAQAAAEQCGRPTAMEIEHIAELEATVHRLAEDHLLIVPHEVEREVGLRDVIARQAGQPIALLIGPEGGWSGREVDLIRAVGGVAVSLGPRILRTETAAVVACALVLYESGELGPR